jgi:hypothetical protein
VSRGRPPRRPRYAPRVDVLDRVVLQVTKLTAHELGVVMFPIRESLTALREGVATEFQWSVLASAIELALAIEDKGVVRGIRGHIKAAEQALHHIKQRALATGAWTPSALYYQEIDDITAAVDLHAYQLGQLSSQEATRALDVATRRVREAGGRVLVKDGALA